MTNVYHKVKNKDGQPIEGLRVIVTLYQRTRDPEEVGKYDIDRDPDFEELETWELRTDRDGYWSLDLEPNDDFDASGSTYRVYEYFGSETDHPVGYEFRVPKSPDSLDLATMSTVAAASLATSANPAPQDAQYLVATRQPDPPTWKPHTGKLPNAQYVLASPNGALGRDYLGTASQYSGGLAGSWTHPAMGVGHPTAGGFYTANFDMATAPNNSTNFALGKLYAAQLPYPKLGTPSPHFFVKTAGTSLSNCLMAIYEMPLQDALNWRKLTEVNITSLLGSTGLKWSGDPGMAGALAGAAGSSTEWQEFLYWVVIQIGAAATIPELRTCVQGLPLQTGTVQTIEPMVQNPYARWIQCNHTNHTGSTLAVDIRLDETWSDSGQTFWIGSF